MARFKTPYNANDREIITVKRERLVMNTDGTVKLGEDSHPLREEYTEEVYGELRFPQDHEVNTLPSKTIPEQAFTVQQLMTRYAQGLPLTGTKVPVYHGDEFVIPEFEKMDYAERQEWMESLINRRGQIVDEINEQNKAAKEAAEKAAEAALEKKIREKIASEAAQKPA